MKNEKFTNELKKKDDEIAKLKAELDLVKTQMNLILDLEDLALWDWNVSKDAMANHNGHWKELYDMENKDLSEQFYARTKPEDMEELAKVYELHAKDKASKFSQAFRLSNLNERGYKWISTTGRIIERDEEGNPSRVVGVSKDISKQKRAEKKLVSAGQKYLNLFNNLNSFYAEYRLVFNEKGKAVDLEFIRFNKAFLAFLNVDEKDVVRKKASEIFPLFKHDPEWFECFVNTALTAEEQNFTRYALDLGIHIKCTLFSPKKNYGILSFIDVSAEVSAIEEVKKVNTSLNLCLDLDKLGYWEWNVQEDRIIARNKYWKEIYEMRPEKISPQFDERLPKEDAERVWADMMKGLQFDEPINLVFRFWNKERTKLKWIESTGKVLERDNEGNPVRVLGISKDITEEREREQGLIRATKQLNEAQSLSKIGSWYLDLETNEIIWTEEIYRMFGLDSKLPPPTFEKQIKLYSEDSYEILAARVNLTATKGIPYDLELEITSNQSAIGWMRAMGEAVKNTDGKIIGIRGTAQDITEIKEINRKLEERRMFAEALTESSPAGIYVFDKQKHVISYTNGQASEILGYTPSELAEMNFDDLLAKIYPGEEEKLKDHLRSVIKSKKAKKVRFRFKHKEGHYVTCLSTHTVFEYDEKGRFQSFLGSFVDISELDEKEKQLINAKNEAEKANQHKDVFLSNLSHEIRTPMNSIVGFANMLKEDDLSDEKRELYVKQVNDNSKQLLVLLSDILDLTRLESGELPFTYEKLELNQLMSEIHESYSSRLKDRSDLNLESSRINGTGDIFFYSDPIRLKQVINNLIDNAIKYSDSGTIEVGYSSDDQQITFQVKDEGIGISEEDQKAIFERFEQVSRDKYATKGSGLGLAIAKGIISKLDGKIELESTEGEGSVFRVTIPRIETMFTMEADFEPVYSIGKKVNKVLIADDSPTIRLYYTMLLEKYGLDLKMANDGKEAVRYFEENRDVDMVFLDIKMPKLNGIEVMKKIRTLDKDVPIVAQTAFALNDEVKRFLDLGFNHCINKPVAPQELKSILGLEKESA